MSEPFIAEIRIFPYTFAPSEWAYCAGQVISIAQNNALFAIVGDMYGGDGRSTLGLPNLYDPYGLGVAGAGDGPGLTPRLVAQRYGAPEVTLTELSMPAHNHEPVTVAFAPPLEVVDTPSSDTYLCQSLNSGMPASINYKVPVPTDTQVDMAEDMLTEQGGYHSHENRQPFLCVPFCIALSGIFPARN
ncbi:phage tail protein [Gynuella sunshinyii]|uniref:Microcystin-dependent protein n=1 Tax=Gynuella sunshinyii YC6258 TaxID=1445510 RepID=A0A0C5VSR3_9GAMM|nr:tail fiber protein [Gynuella sunshinyii]AJQ93339.1 microcystin-dependent protein [Gynuella sunshinyii YC6258]